MRNAIILVLQLRGVATETIKNVVLAGIGKLIVVDHEDVKEEDLGCGFFFRDEDVGQKVSVVQCSPSPGYSRVYFRSSRDLMSPNQESKASTPS